MDFRPDINALRALAVVAVMLYHFKLPGFSGGFSGVDVFFVISGFLMTAIISGGLERGNFSLWRFFASRARRLIPALIVVCGALLIAGWYWLPPSDYKQLGRHAATALTFSSNFIFKNESGYFDSLSQDKWLLHTWSLSVEWQFYLIYPFILIGLNRLDCSLKRLSWSLAAMTVISLAFCIIYTPKDPALAFFLLPARLWEMSLGGLVYTLTATRTAPLPRPHLIALAGLAMITSGIIAFGEDTLWPGAPALLPVIGCALILAAKAPIPRALAQGPVAALGLWSYSIYLWHWPVVVALRHFDLEHALMWDLLGIAVSIILGAASYYFVETPLRAHHASTRQFRLQRIAIIAAFLCAAGAGLATDRNKGFEERAQAEVLHIESDIALAKKLKPQPCGSDPFVFDTAPCATAATEPDYILWGDSHASSVFTALAAAAGDQRDGHTYQATCPPVPDAYLKSKKYSYHCPEFTRQALARIDALPDHIPLVIAFRMSVYTEGYSESPDKPVGLTFTNGDAPDTAASASDFTERLADTLCDLSDEGRPVYVMQPLPEFGIDVPREISREIMFEGSAGDIQLPLSDYYARQQSVIRTLKTAQLRCGIRVLDPTPYLCSDGVCHGSINGLPLYSDDNHIGVHGSKMLVPMFKQVFPAQL